MHVYVHVPFCARRCSYCDFAIAVRRETPNSAYLASIAREWASIPAAEISESIDTLYLGGGTPSRLDPDAIDALIATLASRAPLAADAEITLEANPDDVTPDGAKRWRSAGVNRVSLGVQSLDPGVLAWMHRTHDATQAALAIDALRRAGIHNISVDLIFALPDELGRDWTHDLEGILDLEPTHLSFYGLTVESHTPLGAWVARGHTVPPGDDRYRDEYLLAHAMVTGAGFEHYEVSNAARPGFRSRHNSVYWSGVPYCGLGPSAHSFDGMTRRWNTRDWEAYRRQLDAGASVIAGSEVLDDAARRLEEWYLALRTQTGIPATRLPAHAARQWCDAGWAHAGSMLRLTAEGWLRLDALVAAASHF